jgi:hypothetical protein
MTTLDLTSYAPANSFLPIDPDSCQAIKRAISAYRKILRNDMPTMAWGNTIRIAKITQADAQDLTGCGCGCS